MPIEPGRTFSHYKVLEKLGQGGQATAYKAEDQRLNRPVVLKLLRPELAASEQARRRFEREACLASALEHPNISAVYDVGEGDDGLYIVMQYVEGRTLKEVVGGRPLEAASALSIAVQIADALAVAHAHGIIHRDVKPQNVIVTAAGQAKVLDFGLAKLLADDPDPATEAGVPYGSVGYGSPEQAMGQRADHRSDIFSLGVILYEMITGQPPFQGRHRLELLNAVVNQAPRPIVSLNPKAPAGLQDILDRALAKPPRERFQTMAAMRDDLKALLRRLTHGEPESPVLAPQHARPSWLLSGPLSRMFSRRRSVVPTQPPPITPVASSAPSRPPSWGTETGKTIAVLPFRNLSGEPEMAFYEFALADAIITDLAHQRQVVVRPSSYIAPYAGQNVDPRQVGLDLAVGSVLIGSFFRGPERMRVTAQLVATETGEILWSDKIDTAARDLVSVQDIITERVIAGLRLRLTPEEQARIERPPTENADAYEYYLRGRDLLFRYVLRSFAVDDLEMAIRMLNEAIGLDQGFAAAHAALGRCYVLHAQGWGGTEYYTLAERALRAALERDPSLVEARLQLVHVDLHHGDKDRCRAVLGELMQEAGRDPAVLYVAGMLARLDGDYERALDLFTRLAELSPQDAVLGLVNRARVFSHQGRLELAHSELLRAQALEPDHPLVRTFQAITAFNQGQLEDAGRILDELLRQQPGLHALQVLKAWCLSASGEHEAARALVSDPVREAARADHDVAFWLASLFAMEGLPDEALEWLGQSVKLGNENVPLFESSPKLASLRQDPRFQELLADLHRRESDRAKPAA